MKRAKTKAKRPKTMRPKTRQTKTRLPEIGKWIVSKVVHDSIVGMLVYADERVLLIRSDEGTGNHRMLINTPGTYAVGEEKKVIALAAKIDALAKRRSEARSRAWELARKIEAVYDRQFERLMKLVQ